MVMDKWPKSEVNEKHIKPW